MNASPVWGETLGFNAAFAKLLWPSLVSFHLEGYFKLASRQFWSAREITAYSLAAPGRGPSLTLKFTRICFNYNILVPPKAVYLDATRRNSGRKYHRNAIAAGLRTHNAPPDPPAGFEGAASRQKGK